MSRKNPPPIIHIVAEHEEEVRAIADEEGLSYVTSESGGSKNIIEFRFKSMDDHNLLKLISKIPQGAWAYKAIVGDVPPAV